METIDPGLVKLLVAAGIAVPLIFWFVLSILRAEMKLNAALPELLNPSVPLSERCAVVSCIERGTVAYGVFDLCTGHDPLRRTKTS